MPGEPPAPSRLAPRKLRNVTGNVRMSLRSERTCRLTGAGRSIDARASLGPCRTTPQPGHVQERRRTCADRMEIFLHGLDTRPPGIEPPGHGEPGCPASRSPSRRRGPRPGRRGPAGRADTVDWFWPGFPRVRRTAHSGTIMLVAPYGVVTGAEEVSPWTARLCQWRSLPPAPRRN
jgi:hypothetical protein